jgi:hypothetical protein
MTSLDDAWAFRGLTLGRRSLGDLLRTAFGLYARHPALFIVPALVVVVAVEVLVTGVGGRVLIDGPDADAGWGWALAGSLGVPFIATPLITAMHLRTVQRIADARPTRVADAIRAGLRAFPVVATVAVVSTVAISIGFILLIVPGVYLATIWAVAAQAAVAEHLGPGAALTRSDELTNGSRWRVLGIVLVLYLIAAAAAAVVEVPLEHVGGVRDSGALFLLGTIIGDTTSLSFVALTGTLLYFDLLARRPGAERHAVPAAV